MKSSQEREKMYDKGGIRRGSVRKTKLEVVGEGCRREKGR